MQEFRMQEYRMFDAGYWMLDVWVWGAVNL